MAGARSGINEPLTAIISILRPQCVVPKVITGAGRWGVRYAAQPNSGFGILVDGSCFIELGDVPPIELAEGDFLLFPQTPAFTMASELGVVPTLVEPGDDRDVRRGDQSGAPAMRMLGGFFQFDQPNGQLLARLLPPIVHIRRDEPGGARLARLVELISEEARADRPGRNAIVERLAEVLLVEALRLRLSTAARPERGLLVGLGDPALARALRGIHIDPARRWTVADLARSAGMSRAVFAERFAQTVGLPPMQYLLECRMAIARDLLAADQLSLGEVAERVGYRSTSAFSTAFTRLTGRSPSQFARSKRA